MDFVALGKRVRIRRKALHLTQEKLAELTGVSVTFVGHVERGTRKLSVETLRSLCIALGVSADFLIGIYKGSNPQHACGLLDIPGFLRDGCFTSIICVVMNYHTNDGYK